MTLISSGILITLVVIIVLLARAYKKVQVQLMKVQIVKTPLPAMLLYEELDADLSNIDEVPNVKNVAYATRKDCRCATPCSDSGEAEGAYYCTI